MSMISQEDRLAAGEDNVGVLFWQSMSPIYLYHRERACGAELGYVFFGFGCRCSPRKMG